MVSNEVEKAVERAVPDEEPAAGDRDEHDVAVEKAKILADARKKEAEQRKEEARLRSEAIQDAVEKVTEGLQRASENAAWSLGKGSADSIRRRQAEAAAQRASSNLTEFEIDEEGNAEGPCPTCGEDLVIPAGRSRTLCSGCGEPVYIPPQA